MVHISSYGRGAAMPMMKRFDAYLSRLCEGRGHADRDAPMREYCSGLMLPLERKSVEPIAAHVGPQAVSAKHQSLLHFVGNSTWSDEAILRSVHDYVMERVPKDGRKGWVLVVDDTGHPKQGRDWSGSRASIAACWARPTTVRWRGAY